MSKKQVENFYGKRGGGVHSALVSRKHVENHSTNPDMSKITLVNENFMLKSYYVEADREKAGHEKLIYI